MVLLTASQKYFLNISLDHKKKILKMRVLTERVVLDKISLAQFRFI